MAVEAGVLPQHALPDIPGRATRARRALVRFARTKPLGTFGAAVVIIFILMAGFPGLFTSNDPDMQFLSERKLGPSTQHWFGTDQLGRDLYARIVYGARTSILIGFGVVVVSAVIATFMGVISGYFGGWLDIIVQRLVDIGIALPGLIFIILFVTSLRDVPVQGSEVPVILRIILSVGLLVSVGSSRVIRSAALSVKQNQYIEAARVIGAGDWRIIRSHILPNVLAVVIVGASIQIGGAVLIESSLAFLGYGVPPPTASWGRMISDARQELVHAPHLAIFPGLAIFLAVYSFNMLGDAIRDVLDPRLRGSR